MFLFDILDVNNDSPKSKLYLLNTFGALYVYCSEDSTSVLTSILYVMLVVIETIAHYALHFIPWGDNNNPDRILIYVTVPLEFLQLLILFSNNCLDTITACIVWHACKAWAISICVVNDEGSWGKISQYCALIIETLLRIQQYSTKLADSKNLLIIVAIAGIEWLVMYFLISLSPSNVYTKSSINKTNMKKAYCFLLVCFVLNIFAGF